MANLVRAIGYSLGKLHIGLISYLIDLYTEGDRKPASEFFQALGIRFPQEPICRREWNSVDLAILEREADGSEKPVILFELKVDDHETGSTIDDYQTIRYAKRWPDCPCFVFITLGRGEYYHPPRSDRFKWIRIREFAKALCAIGEKDPVFQGWADQILREITLQDFAQNNDRRALHEYRAGNWNIYLLGALAELIREQIQRESFSIDITCGTYGTRPDTICSLDWFSDFLYLEINYDGFLNLKISFEKDDSTQKKFERVDESIAILKRIPFPIEPKFQSRGRIGNSKTIASFDIGLYCKDGFLEARNSLATVRDLIISILRLVHAPERKWA